MAIASLISCPECGQTMLGNVLAQHRRAFHDRDALVRRFWSYVDRTAGPEECWLWTRGQRTKGYGCFTVESRSVQAHRMAYELANSPVPEDLCVCHRCDNPPCVNPAHLFLGTNADNVADRQRKGRSVGPQGERAAGSKLTDQAVLEIRAAREPGRSRLRRGMATAFAEKFGVNRTTISRALHGHSFQNLRGPW